MSAMAPRSSTTAKLSRKIRTERGSADPVSASTPRANAMSVATGTAQPSPAPSAPCATATSRPTTKKNNASSPSPAHARSDRSRCRAFGRNELVADHTVSYRPGGRRVGPRVLLLGQDLDDAR